MQGCPGKIEDRLFVSLSPRRPGGEGRVRGADVAVCGAAHLTFLAADAPGPLPLPPKGRRGALLSTAGRVTAAPAIEQATGSQPISIPPTALRDTGEALDL